MKNSLKTLAAILLGSVVIFSACKKDEEEKPVGSLEYIALSGNNDFTLRSTTGTHDEYEKVIVNPLEKLEDCKFIVAGTIHYLLDGVVVAIIDYGDGTCDNIATKTVDGETTEFKLDDGGSDKYKKVVVEPLIKIEGCKYITAGIIELYENKTGELVCIFDWGDGTCDDVCTKIDPKDGTSTDFSLNDYPEYN